MRRRRARETSERCACGRKQAGRRRERATRGAPARTGPCTPRYAPWPGGPTDAAGRSSKRRCQTAARRQQRGVRARKPVCWSRVKVRRERGAQGRAAAGQRAPSGRRGAGAGGLTRTPPCARHMECMKSSAAATSIRRSAPAWCVGGSAPLESASLSVPPSHSCRAGGFEWRRCRGCCQERQRKLDTYLS